mmetsp:Transcript_24221/g.52760  ORF Transcript_24221/g.52760 Transcript_24221/m.52760 type:complete len:643 (+) Transcript_24221:94-2022(+)
MMPVFQQQEQQRRRSTRDAAPQSTQSAESAGSKSSGRSTAATTGAAERRRRPTMIGCTRFLVTAAVLGLTIGLLLSGSVDASSVVGRTSAATTGKRRNGRATTTTRYLRSNPANSAGIYYNDVNFESGGGVEADATVVAARARGLDDATQILEDVATAEAEAEAKEEEKEEEMGEVAAEVVEETREEEEPEPEPEPAPEPQPQPEPAPEPQPEPEAAGLVVSEPEPEPQQEGEVSAPAPEVEIETETPETTEETAAPPPPPEVVYDNQDAVAEPAGDDSSLDPPPPAPPADQEEAAVPVGGGGACAAVGEKASLCGATPKEGRAEGCCDTLICSDDRTCVASSAAEGGGQQQQDEGEDETETETTSLPADDEGTSEQQQPTDEEIIEELAQEESELPEEVVEEINDEIEGILDEMGGTSLEPTVDFGGDDFGEEEGEEGNVPVPAPSVDNDVPYDAAPTVGDYFEFNLTPEPTKPYTPPDEEYDPLDGYAPEPEEEEEEEEGPNEYDTEPYYYDEEAGPSKAEPESPFPEGSWQDEAYKTAYDWLNGTDEEESMEQVAKDQRVRIAVGVLLGFGVVLALMTASCALNNPDGLCAGCCRLLLRCISCFFRVLCLPCRYACCGAGRDEDRHGATLVGRSDLEFS